MYNYKNGNIDRYKNVSINVILNDIHFIVIEVVNKIK